METFLNDLAKNPEEAVVTGMTTVSTVSRDDLADAVRSTALLADLTVRSWSAERVDHSIMNEAKIAHNARGNIGKAVKNLMAGVDHKLGAVRGPYKSARVLHNSLTLPYITNPSADKQTGPRLLPNMLFARYVREMGRLKRAAEARLEEFLVDYPSLALEAQANLGGLADPREYPSVEEVRASFDLSFDFSPIPAHNAFQGLPDGVMEKLATRLAEKQTAAAASSQRAMWGRVREAVEHLVERLADHDTRFKVVTVENVRELITLLPGFNVTGDARVAEIVVDIERMLTSGVSKEGQPVLVTAEKIRDDAELRDQIVDRARAITDKLGTWGL